MGKSWLPGQTRGQYRAPVSSAALPRSGASIPWTSYRFQAPDLYVTVVHRRSKWRTSDARQILRKTGITERCDSSVGNIAGLVTGFLKTTWTRIGRSLEDVIIEPVREYP